jgi:hypothetical protein
MPRRLQLDAVHHLAPLEPGTWRITGSDPQFVVRGPFAKGIWDWTFRAAVRGDRPPQAMQIYYARAGGFTEAASVRLAPLPTEPAARTLRFWLPYDAEVLRFDPADVPGTLVLSDVTARHDGRLTATLRAFARQMRRDGMRGAIDWLKALTAAARGGSTAFRATLVRLITTDEGPDAAELVNAMVAARLARYRPAPESRLLSILTTAYDTPPAYLRELYDSIGAQTWDDFEWILLDNGSRNADTRETLETIAFDPRVTLLRAESNLGIVGGMRRVLERATGRYALPVDSDDYLFPDALATLAAVLQRDGYPALAYSDEDKLRDGRHVDPFVKPDWDPVLFRNCCYIAHLCAIRREDALALGAYTDAQAEGCHDWDTFLRFARAGLTPSHVPEVLYSWRMHGGSTAANVDAKDYVVNSQRHVLEHHLAETGLAGHFDVVRSPLFPVSPDWWIRRKRVDAPPIAIVLDGSAIAIDYPAATIVRPGAAETRLQTWRRAAALAPAVAFVDAGIVPSSDEWIWEMAGLKESFPDAAIIGGRLIGANGLLESDERSPDDPGYFGTALKQRSVDDVSLRFALIDSAWLRSVDDASGDLAAEARRAGKRIVVSPFVEARIVPES